MMRNRILQCMSVETLGFLAACVAVNAADDKKPAGKDGFVSIFDGETLDGWEVSSKEGEKAWTVESGCIAARAPGGPLNGFGCEAKFETQSSVEPGRRPNVIVTSKGSTNDKTDAK